MRGGRATSRITAREQERRRDEAAAPAQVEEGHKSTPPAAGPGHEPPPAQDDEAAPRHCTAVRQAPAAAEASAASTMLVSSSARVIGPTPPGFGLTQPATSATSGCDVAGDLAVDPAHADVEHGGARLDHVLGEMPGTPAAAMTMSARRTSRPGPSSPCDRA